MASIKSEGPLFSDASRAICDVLCRYATDRVKNNKMYRIVNTKTRSFACSLKSTVNCIKLQSRYLANGALLEGFIAGRPSDFVKLPGLKKKKKPLPPIDTPEFRREHPGCH